MMTGRNVLYEAMDWLVERQATVEKALASRHLEAGTLVLYDLTSTYFEGRHCPLAKYGYSRDERRSGMFVIPCRHGRPLQEGRPC
jgi:hypothetical protein